MFFIQRFALQNSTFFSIRTLICALLVVIQQACLLQAELPEVAPESKGMRSEQLSRIDTLIDEGLAAEKMPGCVVCIGRRGGVVLLKAYGFRQLKPKAEPMTVDTVFDMASLTKPIATATSIMQLVERGVIRLRDRVSQHLPEFGQNGKSRVTVHDLLVHQGGLIPDNALSDYNDGHEKAFERIFALDLKQDPGEKFVYTDVGFLVLAELVKRKTGQNIHEFTQENLFGPLGMSETGYLPPDELKQRAAVTEQRDGQWIKGVVHDPRAYRLDGIAGHAGLFSTARDLAVYAQTMLQGGRLNQTRVLSESAVARMTNAYRVSSGVRGLGWDKQTGYSSNRGEFSSERAFGHGGFTGTAMWIDPETQLFVIFLSNRLHPDGKGSVNRLAGRIGTVAAAAIEADSDGPLDSFDTAVMTGIDVLAESGYQQLAGQRIGLITNQTGVDRTGRSTVELLHNADAVNLVALFSPEHGFAGTLDQATIADANDEATGLRVFSLYGQTRKPTAEMLDRIDTLVFDIQDIGARFYTYVSTMGEAMKAAAQANVRFIVLDRPNPINGVDVAGPMLDDGRDSFIAFHSLPVRHGMTVGELSLMFNRELKLDLDLQVIQLRRWRRSQFGDFTGQLWVNPSPNMRNLTEALLYPGIGLLETTNISVGRGTDTPFEVIGAPWIDGIRLARELNQTGLNGVRFVPIRFTPDSSRFEGEMCGGVNLIVTDRKAFEPLRTGFEIAVHLRKLWPEVWEVDQYDRLLRNRRVLDGIRAGLPSSELMALAREGMGQFRARRAQFLLYD